MREPICGLLAMVFAAGPAAAQSAPQGPLAAPDSTIASPSQPVKKAPHKKPKVPKAAKAKLPSYGEGESGHPAEVKGIAHLPSSDDPVSFGMKWNGSNDNAKDTRVQNYNGDAAGTGAELGMKLHF